MKQEEIIANNKLIAEFMGHKTIRINVPFEYEIGEEMPTSGRECKGVVDAMEEVQTEIDEGIVSGCDLFMDAAEYHTSWDMLMPVVSKVNDLYYDELDEYSELALIVRDAVKDASLQGTYDAVVEFIKWYNENLEA